MTAQTVERIIDPTRIIPPERIIHPALAGRVASVLPPPPWPMSADELVKLADSLIGVGMRLAGIIHDQDPKEAGELVAGLTEERAWALPFVMAAMIDIERSALDLLEWAPFTTPANLLGATSVAPPEVLLRPGRRTNVKICGTQAAWDRHRYHDEEPCDACWTAHRAWENDKKKSQRLRKSEARKIREATAKSSLEAVPAIESPQLDLFSTITPEPAEAVNAA